MKQIWRYVMSENVNQDLMNCCCVMTCDVILIRYGELSLKSSYVRRRFISVLRQNIAQAFCSHHLSFSLRTDWGRIYLYTTDISPGVLLLSKIFGITSVSPAIQTTDDLQDISDLAIRMISKQIKNTSCFALRVTRTGTHTYTSQDVAITIGEDIRNATKASVDLTKPDVEFFIEIRGSAAYLFFDKIKGYGGFPVGTQGNVLAFVDSPESLLSAWYMLRRGCRVVFVTTNTSFEKTIQSFAERWNVRSSEIYVFDYKTCFSDIQNILVKKHISALVTRDTLFNSHALPTIRHLKKQIGYPVLTPLIAMNKKEIQQKCGEVGITL